VGAAAIASAIAENKKGGPVIYSLVIGFLVLIALAYVLRPMQAGPRHAFAPRRTRAEEAEERKHAALTAVLELEQELEAGKLAEVDHASLRVEYEQQALEALKELDELRDRSEADALEAEIAAARARIACPVCGRSRAPGEACPRCDG
jgi:hypothetical protein